MAVSSYRVGRRAAVLLAALLVCGCFNYVPTEFDAIPAGKDVRVILTREGMEGLRSLNDDGALSNDPGPVLEGTLVRREAEEVFIRVPTSVRQVGFHQTRLGQDIRIARNQIVQMEERRLDRLGTGLLVGGAALGTLGVIHLILEDARQPQDRDVPDDPELRPPFFSIPLLPFGGR